MFNKKIHIPFRLGPSRAYVDYGAIPMPDRLLVKDFLVMHAKKELTHYVLEHEHWTPGAKFYNHDITNQIFTVPRALLQPMLKSLELKGSKYTLIEDERIQTRPMGLEMNPKFSDREHQIPAIEFLKESKHKQAGLELQTGCLAGTTMVDYILDGEVVSMTLAEAYRFYKSGGKDIYTYSCDGESLVHNKVHSITNSGALLCVRVVLANGLEILATEDHKFQTLDGMVKAFDLVDQEVMFQEFDPEHMANYDVSNPVMDLMGQIGFSKCVTVESCGYHETYDMECDKPHHNFVANNIVVSNSGKTYCATKAAVTQDETTIVIVEGLVEQWVDSIKEQTNISDEDIYVIQGRDSLEKLFASDRKPKFFVASLGTLRPFVNRKPGYETMPTYAEFIKRYGIGIKIVDEAHRALHAISTIDMAGDVPTNIYLTATFLTADPMLKRIFNTYFPETLRFANTYDKYCEVFSYTYNSYISTNATIFGQRYMHAKYEKVMLRKVTKYFNPFMDFLTGLIERHYLKKDFTGKKLLIFFATKKMIEEVVKRLRAKYPYLTVNAYVGGTPDSILDVSDIIVATPKGAGTGTDISNLVTVINTVSFKAETTCRQILGRLRKLLGATPTFVDIHDPNNTVHRGHWFKRRRIFSVCAKVFNTLSG